ncbi:MAG: flagellar basal body-associated FliL family protein [Rhodospirillales bacterium]
MSDDLDDDDEPEEEEEDIEDGEKKPSAGGGKKLIVIGAAAALLILGGGAAVFFTGLLDSLLGGEKDSVAGQIPPPEPPILIEFPKIMVDLKTGRCRAPFIKLKLKAQLSKSHAARFNEVQPMVMDAFQTWLRDHERSELVGRKGTEMMRLKLFAILNNALAPAKAEAIYFREILLQ